MHTLLNIFMQKSENVKISRYTILVRNPRYIEIERDIYINREIYVYINRERDIDRDIYRYRYIYREKDVYIYIYGSVSATAEEFGVDRKQIRMWRTNRDVLVQHETGKEKRKLKLHPGRTVKSELEVRFF